ncbi:MAG: phosphoribosylaminoimidazolesuccinocarboxamide synthase [candidate division WOR-3 bacterium]
MRLLYEGKAKQVYEAEEPGKVIIHFKDSLTAFDAVKKATVEGKGALACGISVKLFQFLEDNGIRTHFLGQLSATSFLARRVRIIPLEVLVRFRAAGSLCKRYGIEKGRQLAIPLVEFSLKDDALHDPLICPMTVLALGLADEEKVQEMQKTGLDAAFALKGLFAERGLELVDMKFEFGVDEESKLYLADEISPDTMRLWTPEGESLDKDVFREDKGDVLATYREVARRLKLE